MIGASLIKDFPDLPEDGIDSLGNDLWTVGPRQEGGEARHDANGGRGPDLRKDVPEDREVAT